MTVEDEGAKFSIDFEVLADMDTKCVNVSVLVGEEDYFFAFPYVQIVENMLDAEMDKPGHLDPVAAPWFLSLADSLEKLAEHIRKSVTDLAQTE